MGLFGTKEITGIDIGAGAIKVVRIARGGRRPKLLSAGLVEFPLDPAKTSSVTADLKYLLSGKKIGGKNVFTLMPGKQLTIRSLILPKMPQAELREAVRWESKRHISYPLEAALIEYLILGEKKEGPVDKYDLLMVAAERGTVTEHLLPFREAGIAVSAVDANPLALRNVYRNRKKTDGANNLIVDIGAGKTEINIFNGSSLRFSRCLETGGFEMTRAVSEQLNIGLQDAEDIKHRVDVLSPPDEDKVVAAVRGRLDAILLEIRRSIEYYKTTFREKGVERTILTGGVSLMTGIKEYFSLSLEGPVELDNPFAGLSCKESILQEFGPASARFSAAVGLALRAV
ncbi:MAG TPA: type IV pilus assembly protein PilM [Nitrospirota bacterium]|nr:type IV pilus assembly protein PilM [Nitrospirota bacterium]